MGLHYQHLQSRREPGPCMATGSSGLSLMKYAPRERPRPRLSSCSSSRFVLGCCEQSCQPISRAPSRLHIPGLITAGEDGMVPVKGHLTLPAATRVASLKGTSFLEFSPATWPLTWPEEQKAIHGSTKVF